MTTQGFVETVRNSRSVFNKAGSACLKNIGQNTNFKAVNGTIAADTLTITCKNKDTTNVLVKALKNIKGLITKTSILASSVLLGCLYVGYRLLNKSNKSLKNNTEKQ